ncbi:UPF0488 protein C8orf33 homolog isoform X1 [Ranitomeya imitator]|uniref:UPF0488 protein C8orf33 homolog isoform X1 n=2 Tax=Ranitomeya imitator TaxID=111125 RepID=UPI0037E797BE
MEEAPKGTFEDELEWCIRQLETGLLRRNPTPRQVEDTQRVLQVLRSRKAPFVKKRQVMNQVFGNYRLKMAEERRVQEQSANNPPEPKIEEVTARDAHSVAYRKSAKDAQSGARRWFTPSGSGFNFNFFPDHEHRSAGGQAEDELEDYAKEVKNTEPSEGQQDGALCLVGGSDFTFNFQIPEETCITTETSTSPLTTHGADGDHLGATHMPVETVPESLSQQCCAASTLVVSANRTQIGDAEEKNIADSPKKKKKKKEKSKAKNTEAPSKAKDPRETLHPCPPVKEEAKSGDDELRRELDWCVEQLEIGLQRQKSTPKQVEEAVQVIKTLRSAKVPLVKKRQVMRVMFGDYRRKMEEERVKQLRLMQAATKSAKMTEVTLTARQNRSKVFRKSIHKSPTSAAPSSAAPADTQGTSDQYTAPSSGQQEFTFRPSQVAFSFNFF